MHALQAGARTDIHSLKINLDWELRSTFDPIFLPMDRISRLKTFIHTYPGDLFSRHALAMEYIKIEQFSEAIAVMKDLLIVDETHSGTYYHLGKLLEKLGDTDHAIEVYEKGISIAGNINASNDLRELKGALAQLKDELGI